MEHRWSARTLISKRVTLFRNKMPVAVCVAKDIGRGGMFVATGPLTYSKNTILDVEIKLDTDQGPERFRLPACVVYRSEAGVGLMFIETNEEVALHIRRLLLNGVRDQQPESLAPVSNPTPKCATA